MKQLVVGTYYAGHEEIELVIREGYGGECWISPERGKVSRIKIGVDEDAWWNVVTVLLHEAMELALIRKGLRFVPCGKLTRDTSGFFFAFDHVQYTDACAVAADYMAHALPDLSRAWKAWRKADRLNAKKARKK